MQQSQHVHTHAPCKTSPHVNPGHIWPASTIKKIKQTDVASQNGLPVNDVHAKSKADMDGDTGSCWWHVCHPSNQMLQHMIALSVGQVLHSDSANASLEQSAAGHVTSHTSCRSIHARRQGQFWQCVRQHIECMYMGSEVHSHRICDKLILRWKHP